MEFDFSKLNFLVTKPFYIAVERILTSSDRERVARGYQEFIRKHPSRLKIDTVLVDDKKQVRERLGWSGIDLPGTFIGIANNKKIEERNVCYTRKTSFDKWEKVKGILSATVTLSNQPLSVEVKTQTSKEKPCKEKTPECKSTLLCQKFLEDTNVNGLQLCVSVKGETKLSKGFGLADVENNLPVTTATKFRINSVSKAVTSVALIKLTSENKLDLDAPIQKYVPSFPEKKYIITTRQLAGHLGGIRDYYGNMSDLRDLVRNEHYHNSTDAIKIFENDSLVYKPGDRFHYSSFGWNLIGAVIEGASGQKYLDYMEQTIWKPVGMLNTCRR